MADTTLGLLGPAKIGRRLPLHVRRTLNALGWTGTKHVCQTTFSVDGCVVETSLTSYMEIRRLQRFLLHLSTVTCEIIQRTYARSKMASAETLFSWCHFELTFCAGKQ